ncbi:MIL1 Probable lipase MIL1 [Candida maltosa Xu316]
MSSRSSFDRVSTSYRLAHSDSSDLILGEGYGKYSTKTSASRLPSLPHSQSSFDLPQRRKSDENDGDDLADHEQTYVEYDLGSTSRSSDPINNRVTERVHTSSSLTTPIQEHHAEDPLEDTSSSQQIILEKPKEEDEDFFSSATNWKSMKKISDMDYYNEKGELEYNSGTANDFLFDKKNHFGYTKIDTEEQVNKYAALDKKTDFLFRSKHDDTEKIAKYHKDDIGIDEEDSDFDDEGEVDSGEALTETKNMLTESQKFAYIGISKLLTVDMATDLARLQIGTSTKIAKQLSAGQKNFSNWIQYVMSKLYDHLDIKGEEKEMIENLCKHGVPVDALSKSLMEIGTKAVLETNEDFDLRWIIICDLFLILMSDGYYDARSRSLLLRFANSVGIEDLEIFQFERRLIECLDMETNEKSIENKDEKLNDQSFVKQQIKKNRKKRLAYIGLATLAGSLALGLSMGLLAPVIGAGMAAGFTTIGITGTGSFLAGVGGSALITTTGVVLGAKVGNKAGARRVGDVQTFEFKPLHNNKRTNLIVTVSGWMNGELDDVRLPFSTVDPVMGDMFSLLWEPEMLQSMGQTIGILASEALSTSIQQILGATILAALMSAIQIPMALSKLTYLLDNPWNVSLDRAWKAGKILADTIVSGNLGVRPITLVGFSLGARLIYSCLIELARRGVYGLIENVIILGSPVTIKIDQIAEARSVVSGRFINGYSKKDWILGYLFRATGGGLSTVAGLSPLENIHGIENIDCTDLVEGHMSYRKAIPKIMKIVGWEVLSEEFAEIEEPDPEQGERQRQLIHEFDEARAKMEQEKKENVQPKGWKKWFKPKKKDWWDIYGQPNEQDDKGEYVDPKLEGPAVFDLDALSKEVHEIERAAQHSNGDSGDLSNGTTKSGTTNE